METKTISRKSFNTEHLQGVIALFLSL